MIAIISIIGIHHVPITLMLEFIANHSIRSPSQPRAWCGAVTDLTATHASLKQTDKEVHLVRI